LGTLIHSVGHGLIADDTIMLGNLVGGEGLTENTVYYVLATGLTADDFAVSESSGGAAVAYTTDITDGVIVRTDTYVAVSDGVMDPPDAVADPDQPVLSSNTDTGVVRIVVTLVAPTSPKVRSVEVQLTNQYSIPASAPDAPIFTDAETITVQPSLTTFSVKAHPSTYYSARVRHIDVYGTASAWTVPFYGAYANIETAVGFDAVLATETSALDHAITTVEIGDQQITAPLLAAQIVLASTIIAGTAGDDRVELDNTGITLFDGASSMRARLPVDTTQPVFVRGRVEAESLESEEASLGGVTSLPAGAVLTAQAGIVKPSAAPVLTRGYLASVVDSGGSGNDWGIAYDGTYVCNPYMAGGVEGPVIVNRWNAATGAFVDDIALELELSNAMISGLAWTGSSWLLLDVNNSTTALRISKFSAAGVWEDDAVITSDITGTKPQAGMFYDATDGVIVVMTTVNTTASTAIRLRKYSPSTLALSSTQDLTGLNVNGTGCGFVGGARVGSSYWIDAWPTPGLIYEFTASTGAVVANSSWGYKTDGTVAVAASGLCHNGSSFLFKDSVSAIYWGSNWTWTTESAKYWVGYSWYDSVGTDETQLGPRASITMYRRMRLVVQHAARPIGATSVYVYAGRHDTVEPTAGTYEYQGSNGTAVLSLAMNSYGTAGKNDETANGFPGGTPSELQSGTPGWSLLGDGTGDLGLSVTGGKPPVRRAYTTGTTWTRPAGLSHIEVEVQGGGGPGGSASTTAAGEASVGGGGGGGGYARALITAADLTAAGIDIGETCTVTVGATKAGSGTVAGNTQASGNASSFAWGTGTTVSGSGGGGGRNGTGGANSSIATGGRGGGGSGPAGTIVAYGGDGGRGIGAGGTIGASPSGGNSHLGGGGQGGRLGTVYPGNAYGGGGGANANNESTSGAVGGSGAAGVVIVTEYYVG
jgi:hypothetical protein